MRGECKEFTEDGRVIKPLDKNVAARVIRYYETCKSQGLLGDYIIGEYEEIKKNFRGT
jgi:hypothetical protein